MKKANISFLKTKGPIVVINRDDDINVKDDFHKLFWEIYKKHF